MLQGHHQWALANEARRPTWVHLVIEGLCQALNMMNE